MTLRTLLTALHRDVRRLALSSAPTLSRSEVAELLGCRETEAAAWLDAHERDLRVQGPGVERRYSGPRVRLLLEAPAPTPRGRPAKGGTVHVLPRPEGR